MWLRLVRDRYAGDQRVPERSRAATGHGALPEGRHWHHARPGRCSVTMTSAECAGGLRITGPWEGGALPVPCRLVALEDLSRGGRGGWPCLDQVMLKRDPPRVHSVVSRDFRVPSSRADPDGEVLGATTAGQIR